MNIQIRISSTYILYVNYCYNNFLINWENDHSYTTTIVFQQDITLTKKETQNKLSLSYRKLDCVFSVFLIFVVYYFTRFG